MPSQEDIGKAFNKFAGREVPLEQVLITPKGHKKGLRSFFLLVPSRRSDPVLKEMREAARAMGLRLFVQWPGHENPPKPRPTALNELPPADRLIARLEKGPDKKWRVAGEFKVGR
jgi:hypothetical protein